MIWQAYVDESIKDDEIIVLAGYLSTAELWAGFSKEWEKLVQRWGRIGPGGNRRFKMNEMPLDPEGCENISAFYRVIEKYVDFSFQLTLSQRTLSNAYDRLRVLCMDGTIRNAENTLLQNPYIYAFYFLVRSMSTNLAGQAYFAGDKIDFIFDDRSEKAKVLAGWSDMIDSRPVDERAAYGASPRFENDEEFLPLQAADFWAWWVRKWAVEGIIWSPKDMPFEGFKAIRPIKSLNMTITENEIFQAISSNVLVNAPPGTLVHDNAGIFSTRSRGRDEV